MWGEKAKESIDNLQKEGCVIEKVVIHHRVNFGNDGTYIGITVVGDVADDRSSVVGENVHKYLANRVEVEK